MKKQIKDIRDFQEKLAEVEENIVFNEYEKNNSIKALDRIVLRGSFGLEELIKNKK